MNAAIDVGNTNVKIGYFSKEQIKEIHTFPADPMSNFYKELGSASFNKCIISSVKPIPEHLLRYLQMKASSIVLLNEKTPLPIKLEYRTKNTLGKDRIAMAVAAHALSKGENSLVISAGTCITYNVTTAKGIYKGGAISPGLNMRLKAMNAFTAELPLVELQDSADLIGNSTEGSLTSGALNGALFEIEGYIRAIENKYSPLKIFICGGDSSIITKNIKREVTEVPDLVLTGLIKILNFNAGK